MLCVCIYLYIHNKYTQYKHIYYVNTNFYFDIPNSIIQIIHSKQIK